MTVVSSTAKIEMKHGKKRIEISISLEQYRCVPARSIDLKRIKNYTSLRCNGYTEEGRRKRVVEELSGQQIIDNLLEMDLAQSDDLKQLIEIWRRWHLNDLNAGTRAQREILKKCHSSEHAHRVECLVSNGLYDDKGYRYGIEWLVEPLPESVERKVRALVKKLGGKFVRN